MNQHLHSPTKLTEFARDFEEEPDTLFGRFVNKIQNAYNHSYNTMNDVPNGGKNTTVVAKSVFYADASKQEESTDVSRDSSTMNLNAAKHVPPSSLPVDTSCRDKEFSAEASLVVTEESKEVDEKLEEAPVEASEGRTMVNVLKRISNIMASKNSDLRNYRDTDLQRFWMPDSKAKECYDCSQKFSTFRRKHHCRLCGQIFCSKCCNQVVPGKIIMCSGDLKVCNYCSKIVLSYLKSPNITVDLHADLQALQQDLSSKLDDSGGAGENILANSASLKRKISVGYQEERFATYQQNNLSNADRKNILQQSNSLITLHEELQRTLPAQNCGTALIEFLIRQNKSSNKIQAVAILSAMLAAGFLQPIVPDSEQTEFDENLHYKFAELQRSSHNQDVDSTTKAYSSNFSDISEANSPLLDKTQPPPSLDSASHISPSSGLEYEAESSIRSTTIASKLLESYCEHEEQIVAQMLQKFKLDIRWSKVLLSLCCRAANHFKPEYCTNDLMDIRNYVNFKKLPGGRRKECKIVGGVVFSKNVAHKDMATRVDRPRILLLQCPIVYERIEGKFVSISTVLLQEKEYLRNVTERIMSFQPNVILVHKNVAGIAQDMLRAKGITLVLDVKLSVMERLARTLQCDIVNSIESNIAKPKLGVCDAFYIQSYYDGHGTSKTLMFFEKLSSPRGYTCLLRGGSNTELAKVKRVASFLVYARYNWRLEMSFLLDEYARPLSPQPSIFDSKDTSPADENADPNREQLQQEQDEILTPANACQPIKGFNGRRLEEKIQTSVPENVADFTDPLRTAEISSDTSSVVELAVEMRYDNRFRNALTSTVLSVSPFLTFPLPYLETEQGRKCALRSLFPTELYYSKQLSATSPASNVQIHNLERVESLELVRSSNETELKPPHPFLTLKITTPIDNREIQTLLAEFRAFGGRYGKKKRMIKLVPKRQNSYQLPQKVSEDHIFKDALDIDNHQRLPVLFCSFYFNPQSPSFCAPPTLLDMKFYGQQDIMLGQFLQRYCCRLSSICTLCDLPMLGHVRRYVHYMGCVQVFLKEDSSKAHTNVIYFTAWCTLCNEVTPSVPLSESTKCLSFAKYLELRFHGHAYRKQTAMDDPDQQESLASTLERNVRCQHSLHRDYIHYFTYRGVGAKFVYTPIEVWEVELPTLVLDLLPPKPFNHFQVLEEIKSFSMRGHEIFTRIHERIADLATEDENSPLLISFKTTLSMDQFVFKQHVEIVQTLLTESKANYYDITDALLMARRVLAASIEHWTPRLHDMATAQKLASKQQQQQQHDNLNISSAPHVDAGTICTEDVRPDNADVAPISEVFENASISEHESSQPAEYASATADEAEPTKNQQPNSDKKVSVLDQTLSTAAIAPDKKSIKNILIHLLPSAHHANMMQSPFLPQEHYTLPLGTFPILVHDHDLSSIIAYSLTSHDYQRSLLSCTSGMAESANASVDNENASGMGNSNSTNPVTLSPSAKRKSQENSHDSDDNARENATTSNKNVSSSSMSGPNVTNNNNNNSASSSVHIELAFQDSTTQFSCKIYFAQEFDLMRLRTLRPPKIGRSLYKELEESKKREELKVSQGRMGSFCPEIEIARRSSEIGATTTTNLATNMNTKHVSSDGSAGEQEEPSQLQAEMEECRIFLARSLCSSVQWEARGGKSGSRFCKTLDDRFVLKEMSKNDINIFANFAPNYFEYINKCQRQNQPTLLAKIFGVYKVTIKNKDFCLEKSLLVMENLFYDRDIKNKFDLKGSERNRLVEPTNQHGEEVVLLDENLMQMSWSKPLYVLSHSKAVLKDAIFRDSSFLEKNKVMDYSLLVGLDNKKGVLVLGIIDYIRTFTFDKKVESFVKQQTGGFLGARGKLPTVIPPERYKQRFTESMDRYFNTVPDRWEGLAKI